MSALKLVFPTKYFLKLGKTIIYVELFYFFQGNYGDYFKIAGEIM